MAMGGWCCDEEGLFQTKRVKGHRENDLSDAGSSDWSQKSSTQIKSETVALCKLSLHADLRQSLYTVGGGFPQLTSQ